MAEVPAFSMWGHYFTQSNYMQKTLQAFLLPTDKAENALLLVNNKELRYVKGYFTQEYLKSENRQSFHLYYCSTEDIINNGDWYLAYDGTLCQRYASKTVEGDKKIIATTDLRLIKSIQKVASIPKSEIERQIAYYNTHGSIQKEVEVEYEVAGYLAPTDMYEGEIKKGHKWRLSKASMDKSQWSIPHQIVESWEAFYEPKLTKDNEIIIVNKQESFSREEMMAAILEYTCPNILQYSMTEYKAKGKEIQEWFNSNIKI